MNRTRPLIGITVHGGKNSSGLPTAAVQTAYIQAIRQADGLPLLIPNQLAHEEWQELYPRFGGILFTGGGDIEASLFDGDDHPGVGEADDERDTLELPLLRAAAADGKPFLGICRGLQLANAALGGRLYTHIADQLPGALRHDWHDGFPRTHLAHPIWLEEGSRMAAVLGQPVMRVNNLHHQGIKDLAPDLQAVAFAPDGLVEAVELPKHPFGLAVQWHPEWLTDQPAMRYLFAAFVEAASG